jgi:hypothetical protein
MPGRCCCGRQIGLIDRVAACFRDGRDPARVVHSLRTLIGQRIIGLALGYEDLNDHDDLRFGDCQEFCVRTVVFRPGENASRTG